MLPFQTSVRRTLAAGVLLAAASAAAEQPGPYFLGNRILIDAAIDQQPVRLVLDTGASFTALTGFAKSRLNLKVEDSTNREIGSRSVIVERSEPVAFQIFGRTQEARLPMLPSLTTPGTDGVVSWRDLTSPVILLDGIERRISTPSRLPEAGWQKWKLDPESRQLFFQVTKEGEPVGRVFVDTGADVGLRLAPRLWRAWKAAHPEAGITLERFRYALGEETAQELAWSEEHRLGDLPIYACDIGPIPDVDDDAKDAQGRPFIAMLGMRALRNMRVAIQRESSELATQSISPVPQHNRAGALFLRNEAGDLVARVIPGSPAHVAGLEDGDLLVSLGGKHAPDDDQEATRVIADHLAGPAGTQLDLEIKRGQSTKAIRVVLRDLLK